MNLLGSGSGYVSGTIPHDLSVVIPINNSSVSTSSITKNFLRLLGPFFVKAIQ